MSFQSNLPVFKSLLLLLVLMVMMKTGISMPRRSDCTQTEGKDPSQTVSLNIKIINHNKGSTMTSDYRNRSTTPWDMIPDEDPNRLPRTIWQARCRTITSCLNGAGKEDHRMNSVGIQQEIFVLRRELSNCSTSFRLEKMLVTVGCTCVFPRTVSKN